MVSTYKAIILKDRKAVDIVLQALSSQNMADMVRSIYGANTQIVEISEIKEDWK